MYVILMPCQTPGTGASSFLSVSRKDQALQNALQERHLTTDQSHKERKKRRKHVKQWNAKLYFGAQAILLLGSYGIYLFSTPLSLFVLFHTGAKCILYVLQKPRVKAAIRGQSDSRQKRNAKCQGQTGICNNVQSRIDEAQEIDKIEVESANTETRAT